MMRSLYSGVSGLRTHQTKMDVIGNNIANVNTTAFKSSRTTFKNVYFQTLSSASESNAVKGGTNGMQVGYGTALNSIDIITTQGGIQTTDRALDLYLSGDGYFVMQDSTGITNYTRAGNFGFDTQGGLVDSNGNYLAGWMPTYVDGTDPTPITITDLSEYSDLSISKDGTITGIRNDVTESLGQIAVAKFSNPGGLSQQDGIYFQETKNSGVPIVTYPGDQSTGTIISGGLEMSNVDLSKELTDMITAERGFQANSRVITVSDEMLQDLVNLKR